MSLCDREESMVIMIVLPKLFLSIILYIDILHFLATLLGMQNTAVPQILCLHSWFYIFCYSQKNRHSTMFTVFLRSQWAV